MTMADPIIELQELLNRASGPGKIGPDKPLETRLYGANGQPIGTAGNPLQVKAQDTDSALGQIKAALGPLATETKLEAVRTLLAAIAEKDFATQGTLAQVKQALDTLNGLVSTSAGQTAIADAIQTLSDAVATQQTLAQAVTQLTNIVNKLNSTLTVDGKVELKGSVPDTTVLFTELTTDAVSDPVQLNGAPWAVLEASICARADITVQVSDDGVSWRSVITENLNTGTRSHRIDTPSSYKVPTSGSLYVRAIVANRGGLVTASLKLCATEPKVLDVIRRPPVMMPDPYPPESQLFMNTATRPVTAPWVDEGVVYGFAGTFIRKSTNNGESYSNLKNLEVPIQQIHLLDNKKILACLNDGSVVIYDESDDSIVQAFTTGDPNRSASSTLPNVQVFKNYVFLGEYGPNNVADNPRHIYMSNNYGEPGSWQTIFDGVLNAEAPNPNWWHLHALHFDPYRNVVWAVNGDTRRNSNVWWTKLGEWDNWRKVYRDGECPNQWTTVYALPNCVLFGSDNLMESYWRWDAPPQGIDYVDEIVIEPAFVPNRLFGDIEAMATSGLVTYGKNAALYVGFVHQRDTVKGPAVIYGTPNGYDWYPMWISPENSTAPTNNWVGISSVTGIGPDGYIHAAWSHRPEGAITGIHGVRFKEPQWVTR